MASARRCSVVTTDKNPISRWPHGFFKEFIRLYKDSLCLWKYTDPGYTDRNQKNIAYARLIRHCQLIVPDADVHFVRSKINSIRVTFKKEYNKVLKVRMKTPEAPPYVPKLWYYDMLKFVVEQEYPRQRLQMLPDFLKHISSPDDSVQSTTNEANYHPQIVNIAKDDIILLVKSEKRDVKPSWIKSARDMVEPSYRVKSEPGIAANRSRLNSSVDIRSMVNPAGQSKNSNEVSDEFDAYGKIVASKLRIMQTNQRLYAENIVNEALYKGILCQLTASSHISKFSAASTTSDQQDLKIDSTSQNSQSNQTYDDNNNNNNIHSATKRARRNLSSCVLPVSIEFSDDDENYDIE